MAADSYDLNIVLVNSAYLPALSGFFYGHSVWHRSENAS